MKQLQCDLLVMGGGGAGLVAAARAAYLNPELRIILVEKAKTTGGGAIAAGDFRVYQSKWQKEHGCEDNFDVDLRKYMDQTYWRLDRKLAYDAFVATGRFVDWSFEMDPEGADKFEPGRYVFDLPDKGPLVPIMKGTGTPGALNAKPGKVSFGPGPEAGPGGPGEGGPGGPGEGGPGGPGGPMGMRAGTYYMRLMKAECDKRGVTFLLRHRVTDVESEQGHPSLVICEDLNTGEEVRISCRGLVMAAGSWIRNEEQLRRVCPPYAELDLGRAEGGHTNSNYSGDGIALAEKLGAFVDYDSFCIRPMGPYITGAGNAPKHPKCKTVEAMSRSAFAMQINTQGRRFTCENSIIRLGTNDSAHIVLEQGSTKSWVVFDLNNAKAAQRAYRLAGDGGQSDLFMVSFPEDVEADLEAFGLEDAMKADTIEELARQMGVPAQNLKETLETYNRGCRDGFDYDCFKEKEYLVEMTGPFYAVELGIETDGAFGGVLVNAAIEAYNSSKDGVVPGLWVPGDFSSGRFMNDLGVKRQIINDLAWAVASGMIAGESAAAYLK